jgi:hypothetical protein
MTLTTALLAAWIRAYALLYGVEPEFALAVAHVESGCPGQEFRVGPMGKGKYYGPFGIHRDFLRRWPINEPEKNIEIGVKALRGRDQRRVLRRYNAAFDEAYWRAVQQARRRWKNSSQKPVVSSQ